MSVWAGFSEEELRKLQQKEQTVPAALDRGRKPAPTNRSRQQLQRERALQVVTQQKNGPDSHTLPVEQQLSKPPIQAAVQPVSHFSVTHTTVEEDSRQKEPLALNDAPAPAQDTSQITRELEKQEVELLDVFQLLINFVKKQCVKLAIDQLRREKTRLEFLQRDQKMIEERNKRKKALLTKTIAEKSKQTHAEAVKLKRIQKELQTLDNMVSSDIGILRGVIEQASMDYNAARKRYEKAEAEYVTAKLDLHKKTDVKEQLTEHLCAIIQQNELRKAHKLEELLQQLHLQTAEEEPEGEERGRPAEDRGATKVQEESKNAVLASPVNGSTPGTEKETQAGSTTLLPVCPAVTVTEPNGRDQNSKPSNGPLAGQCEVPASPS